MLSFSFFCCSYSIVRTLTCVVPVSCSSCPSAPLPTHRPRSHRCAGRTGNSLSMQQVDGQVVLLCLGWACGRRLPYSGRQGVNEAVCPLLLLFYLLLAFFLIPSLSLFFAPTFFFAISFLVIFLTFTLLLSPPLYSHPSFQRSYRLHMYVFSFLFKYSLFIFVTSTLSFFLFIFTSFSASSLQFSSCSSLFPHFLSSAPPSSLYFASFPFISLPLAPPYLHSYLYPLFFILSLPLQVPFLPHLPSHLFPHSLSPSTPSLSRPVFLISASPISLTLALALVLSTATAAAAAVVS